jgi:hypothetical protein
MPGGPTCTFRRKTIHCFIGSSPKVSITSQLLADMLGVYEREPGGPTGPRHSFYWVVITVAWKGLFCGTSTMKTTSGACELVFHTAPIFGRWPMPRS